MIYAHDIRTGQRIEATPGARALCPSCSGEVMPKCGDIISWHWAHATGTDCDTWAEPDSQWHRAWQMRFPAALREITIGNHRADVVGAGGILEVQHSAISAGDIREREAFYQQVTWIFDAREAYTAGRLDLRTNRARGGLYRSFRWKHPRKTIGACRGVVFLDLAPGILLHLRRLHLTRAPYGGWGHLATDTQVIDHILRGGSR